MMRSRSSYLRSKIVFLLVSMTALWGFAAVVTVREGLNLLFVNTLDTNVGRPTEQLLGALQQERRLSVVALSGDTEAQQALAGSRHNTDEALVNWSTLTSSGSLDMAASDQLKQRIDDAAGRLDDLAELRDSVDAATTDRTTVVADFAAMIEAGFNIYTSISGLDDPEIAKQSRTLVALSRARELLAQQDALLAGALAAGRFTEQDIVEFTKLVGAQRFLYASTSVDLPPEDAPLYREALNSPAVLQLRGLEELVIQRARPDAVPPFSAQTWQDTIGPAMAAMRDLELAAADNTLQRAVPAAVGVIVRLILAGGLGLIAVVAAVTVSITTARRLLRQLERLRDAAHELSDNRLPAVVQRLSQGEHVDVAKEAPPLAFGNDEIGQVGQAFNTVQETAIKAAVQQAELRHGVRDVFLSLARRTQNLVHKQLGVLDAMERRQTDADEMEELFRVDHLATRMRRNAENLIVLSGANPGRTWRKPVAMIDVVRGALAEVEDYTRVTLLPVESAALEGRAVGDVIHLLAELIENAVSFSPPYAAVHVGGQRVAHGFAVEVEDRGLGMSEAELEAVNRKLAEPPDFSLADASRLGHYVVAKLAQRHGVQVHLRPSPYGGIVAIVLIPNNLLSDIGDDAEPSTPRRPQPGRLTRDSDGGSGSGRTTVGTTTPVALRQRPDTTPLPAPDSAPARGPVVAGSPDTGPPDLAAPGAPDTTMPRPPGITAAGGAVTGGRAAGAPEAPGAAPESNGAAAPESNGRRTAAGLPWRVRQASLAKHLRDGNPADNAAPSGGEPVRDPEQVRRMMRSYQHGTQRGRTEADDAGGTAAGSGESDSVPRQSSTEQPGESQEG